MFSKRVIHASRLLFGEPANLPAFPLPIAITILKWCNSLVLPDSASSSSLDPSRGPEVFHPGRLAVRRRVKPASANPANVDGRRTWPNIQSRVLQSRRWQPTVTTRGFWLWCVASCLLNGPPGSSRRLQSLHQRYEEMDTGIATMRKKGAKMQEHPCRSRSCLTLAEPERSHRDHSALGRLD